MKFVDKLKSLSPEELEETKRMVDTDEAFAAQMKSEIDMLDENDTQLVKSILTGQPSDMASVPEGQEVNALREGTDLSGKGKSAVQGFMQAIPFSDEIQAATGVVADMVTGNTQDLSTSYQENLDFIKQYDKNAEEKNPGLYQSGRVVGEVATSALAGTGAVKALGGAAKLSKAGVVATHLGSDVVMETARQLSAKERVTFDSFLESAETASMYGALGLGIGTAVGKSLKTVGKYASKIPSKVYEKSLIARGSEKMAKRVDNFLSDQKLHNNNPVTQEDYVKAMKNVAGYEDLVKKGDLESAQILLTRTQSNQKAAKESVIQHLEGKFPEDFGISAKEAEMLDYAIFDEIHKVAEKLKGAKPSDIKKLDLLKKRVTSALSAGKDLETGEAIFGNVNYTQLQSALDSLQDAGKMNIPGFNGDKILGKIRNVKNGLHNKIPRGADESDIAMLTSLDDMNKSIQVYKHAGDVKANVLKEMSDMSEAGILGRAIDNAAKNYNKHSRGSGLFGYTVTGPLAGTIGFAKSLLVDPSTLGKIPNIETIPALKATMDKVDEVGNFFAHGSGSKSTYAGTLMQRMFTSIKDNDVDTANMQFKALESTKNMLQSPMDRTTESFLSKKDDILNIVSAESPEMAEQLLDSLRNKEDVGPIITELAKTSAGKELIMDGVGFDGKVYSPEDKAALEKDLLDNLFVPGDYKVQMIKALRNEGVIPDMESVPKREPRKPNKRKNKRPY